MPAVALPEDAEEAASARPPAGETEIGMNGLTEGINWVAWLRGAEDYIWPELQKGAQEEFKQPFTSKESLVQKLVVDRKFIRPERVCPELAQYLSANADAPPAHHPPGRSRRNES
jgi:hypothetical protein